MRGRELVVVLYRKSKCCLGHVGRKECVRLMLQAEVRGYCPMRQEQTPSLAVYD